MNLNHHILLIGTGPMAEAYTDVLKSLAIRFTVVGRDETSAAEFTAKTKINAVPGGIENFLTEENVKKFDHAIIATGPENLLSVMEFLLQKGIVKILVEKPAALSIEELLEAKQKLEQWQDQVFVAYNRRFYGATELCKQLIQEDGGLETMQFEFTELVHLVERRPRTQEVLSNWYYANSTHVIDMAFHLAGKPVDWQSYVSEGVLSWHPKTKYAGAGVTDKGVLFSYLSNWDSAGRWAIELMTPKRRIYLKPLEKVHVQEKGTFEIYELELGSNWDNQFKPGLYKQVESFVYRPEILYSLKSHFEQTEMVFLPILQGKK